MLRPKFNFRKIANYSALLPHARNDKWYCHINSLVIRSFSFNSKWNIAVWRAKVPYYFKWAKKLVMCIASKGTLNRLPLIIIIPKIRTNWQKQDTLEVFETMFNKVLRHKVPKIFQRIPKEPARIFF